MSTRLPYELWERIARYATERLWHPSCFNPPAGDFNCIHGFAGASTLFGEIINTLKDEELVISAQDFLNSTSKDHARHRIRRLEITAESPVELPNFCKAVSYEMTGFSMITSLSLPTISSEDSPLHLVQYLHTLPIHQYLECLDIRGRRLVAVRKERLPAETEVVHFPNLLRLRFTTDPRTFEFMDVDFTGKLACFLSGCGKLELLSLGVVLDDFEAWDMRNQEHDMSLDHLQPSEGYQRTVHDCPLCYAAYDHATVVQRENYGTRMLAEELPSLTEVRWANVWKDCRATRVSRSDDGIALSSDDGRDSHI